MTVAAAKLKGRLQHAADSTAVDSMACRPGAFSGRVRYRPDVDGLRAVAVLLVVANHLSERVSGGYVGVDVFFVISGYLISAVVLSDMRRGQFSLVGFYERRVRRILPALLAMLLATSALVWFCFTPDETQTYAETMLAALASVSNFVFWSQSSYFDAISHSKPLLHTWSLAVEEQFYIFFPLLLMLVFRYWRKRLSSILCGAAIVSFVAAAITVPKSAPTAFFLFPFRAWELLIGTILSQGYLPQIKGRLARNVASLSGALLILVPALRFTERTPFPGIAALAPCIGAALVIAAGETGSSAFGRVLAWRPTAFIGKISYSLYLWHWPLIVFQSMDHLLFGASMRYKPFLFGLSLAVSILSWAFVEEPFRRGRLRPSRRRLFALAGIGAGVVVCVAGVMLASGGLPERYTASAAKVARYGATSYKVDLRAGQCFFPSSYDVSRFQPSECLAERPGRRSILLLGDSHAAVLWPGLMSNYSDYDLREVAVSGCRPILSSMNDPVDRCRRLYQFVFGNYLLSHHVDVIVLSARWERSEFDQLQETIRWAHSHGLKVVIIGPVPEFDVPLPHLLAFNQKHEGWDDLETHETRSLVYLDREMKALAENSWHVGYLSTFDIFCTPQCSGYASQDVPLLFDTDHLTPEASRSLVGAWRRQGAL